ncbi:hypothetical protein FCOIX_13550 [Fusarium coicis]|nr:hypothetical protein FCOIX_13550 [Fusarium coicis]
METQQQQQNYSFGAAVRDTVYSHEGFEKHFEILSKTDFWLIVLGRHITRDCVSKSGMTPSNKHDCFTPISQRHAPLRATENVNLAAEAVRDGALIPGRVIAPNATVQSSKQGDQKPEAKIYLPERLLLWHKSCHEEDGNGSLLVNSCKFKTTTPEASMVQTHYKSCSRLGWSLSISMDKGYFTLMRSHEIYSFDPEETFFPAIRDEPCAQRVSINLFCKLSTFASSQGIEFNHHWEQQGCDIPRFASADPGVALRALTARTQDEGLRAVMIDDLFYFSEELGIETTDAMRFLSDNEWLQYRTAATIHFTSRMPFEDVQQWAKKRGDKKSTQDRSTSPGPPAFLANDQSLTETFSMTTSLRKSTNVTLWNPQNSIEKYLKKTAEPEVLYDSYSHPNSSTNTGVVSKLGRCTSA